MVGYQLDDSQSLHRKMVGNHQTSIFKWLALGFQVGGGSKYCFLLLPLRLPQTMGK